MCVRSIVNRILFDFCTIESTSWGMTKTDSRRGMEMKNGKIEKNDTTQQ
jgi:hypothetical protein